MSSADHSPQLLTLPQLAARAGVGKRTLHVWVQKGLVEPSLQTSSGKGVPNLFSAEDVTKVEALRELRQAGVGLDRLQLAAEAMRKMTTPLKGDEVLVLNGRAEICSDGETLSSALGGSGAALMCRLGPGT